jgi:hypothetical protein
MPKALVEQGNQARPQGGDGTGPADAGQWRIVGRIRELLAINKDDVGRLRGVARDVGNAAFDWGGRIFGVGNVGIGLTARMPCFTRPRTGPGWVTCS